MRSARLAAPQAATAAGIARRRLWLARACCFRPCSARRRAVVASAAIRGGAMVAAGLVGRPYSGVKRLCLEHVQIRRWVVDELSWWRKAVSGERDKAGE